jgi:hypothetical protein
MKFVSYRDVLKYLQFINKIKMDEESSNFMCKWLSRADGVNRGGQQYLGGAEVCNVKFSMRRNSKKVFAG